jgi:hypothetical protein
MLRRTIYALGYAAEVVRYELSQAKLAHSAKRTALAEWRSYKPSEDKTLDFQTDADGRIYPEHLIHPMLSRS